jgi:hypothetical protein
MSLVLNGNGTIQNLVAGGLPDGSVTADDIASTLDLSGKTITNMNPSGIYLGGTGAANYLDDYEEGTFTSVTITGSDSGSGSVPCSAAYTKVGRIVTLTIDIANQTFPSFTGQLRCSLPFTVGSRIAHGQDIYYYPPANWDAQANWVGAKVQAQAGTSYVVFPDITLDSDRQTVLTNGTTNLSGQSNIYLAFTITYQAA